MHRCTDVQVHACNWMSEEKSGKEGSDGGVRKVSTITAKGKDIDIVVANLDWMLNQCPDKPL